MNKDSPINNLNDMLAKRKELTFGQRRPELHLRLPCPRLLRLRQNNASASDFKRDGERQPRNQRSGRGQQSRVDVATTTPRTSTN